jgi:hypothetical protein
VSALQRWDRDFDKVKHLINVEEPKRISDQQVIGDFTRIGPSPEDIENVTEKNNQLKANPAHPSAVQGSDGGRAKSKTAGENEQKEE